MLLEDLGKDLRYAVRTLKKQPVFTLVIVLTLALGIGANTAIFTILNSLLLRTLPVYAPERLVHVTDSVLRETGEIRVRAWSYPVWEQIRRRPHLFEAATAWSFVSFNTAAGGETQPVEGIWADGGFFEMLRVPAMLGRTFSPIDDGPGGGPDGPVAVIGYGYWQRQFGGAADVIGRTVRLDGVPFTIVGVTPPAFFGVEVGRSFDVIVPLRTEALVRGRDSVLGSSSNNFLSILARLPPGRSIEAVTSELRGVQADIREVTTADWTKDVAGRYLTSPFTLVPASTGFSYLRDSYQRPVLILSVTVALVLLIGCINITNLLLARATARQHEWSVRLALGASRWRLARQLFAESLILAIAGAGLGLVIAANGSRALVEQLSTSADRIVLDVSLGGPVLLFTLAVAMMTTMLFGTAPAFASARVAPMDAIKEQGRTVFAHRRGGVMGWLVVAQVALSMVLVVAAGLFIQSFTALANRPLGLQPDRVLVVTLDGRRASEEPAERMGIYADVREAVAGLPNVAAAAISHLTPAGGGGWTPAVEIPGGAGGKSSAAGAAAAIPANQDVFGNRVSVGWFETFGVRLIAGRDFDRRDGPGAPRTIVVNETFARRFLGVDGAIGRSVVVYPNTPRALRADVVGVVADAIYGWPHERVPATFYLPTAQFDVAGVDFESVRLSVRAEAGSPAALIKSVTSAAATVNPRLQLTFRVLADQIHASLARERLMAQLAGALGALALLLAALGLYGLASYGTSLRRAEIAIRLALGAAPGSVAAAVLGRVAMLIGLGLVAGTAISIWATKFVDGLIYGLPPREPMTLAGAVIVLSVIGGFAAWLPARQAMRVNPIEVLRKG